MVSIQATLLIGGFGILVGAAVTFLVMRAGKRNLATEFSQFESRIQAIFRHAPAEIYLKDEQGRYVMINPEFERLFHVKNDEVVGLLPTDVHDDELGVKTRAHDLSVLNEKKTVVRDEIVRTDDGLRTLHTIKFPTFDRNKQLTGLGAIVTDVTDLRTVEMEHRQFQKMEAIGQITGGIAHDFNNLLAVIMGNLELIEQYEDEVEVHICIREALEATKRGAELTTYLLSFARKAPLLPELLDLNDLVNETNSWGSRVLPRNIDIDITTSQDLWPVSIDKTMAQTALLNVILNAKDAMPTGGRIQIILSNVDHKKTSDVEGTAPPASGPFVCLEIRDSGHGIKSEIRDEIFTPFFTTKAVGKGSGLGLSMVQGFIKQSNGLLEISSEPNRGTSVRLYFRACKVGEESKAAIRADTHLSPKKGSRVLVAEDDVSVRNWLQRYLEVNGNNVTAAPDGDQALTLFQQRPQDFDLLISDIVMPGELQGPALAYEVRKIRPDLPVIFLSGYAKESGREGVDFLSGETFLMKPIKSSDLRQALYRSQQDQVAHLS
jgi:PAS domain S-box-containing protein